jgi:transketolase
LNLSNLEQSAVNARKNILRLAAQAGTRGHGAHIGSSLSIVEILDVLFQTVLRQQDVFVLSKGHGGLGYYTALYEVGKITIDQLNTFEMDGSDFPGQPSRSNGNGIAFSSGSLGMGLPYACGLALAAKKQGADKKIYVLLGDGEMNEGSNWESVMFARHQRLGNLIAVIDHNGMQSDGTSSDILELDLQAMFTACKWQASVCDGHNISELVSSFQFESSDLPKCLIAKTVKGKGVSFMENNNAWHHSRLNEKQYQNALQEINTNEL